MRQFRKCVAIDAPAGAVWAVVSDVVRWPEWAPTFTRITPLGPHPRVGAVYRIEQPRLPPSVMTVEEWREREGFTWVSNKPMLRTVGSHWIEAVRSNECMVCLEFRFEGFLSPLLGLLVGKLVDEYVASEAASLKARVEALNAQSQNAH